jgi:hypothetical protein
VLRCAAVPCRELGSLPGSGLWGWMMSSSRPEPAGLGGRVPVVVRRRRARMRCMLRRSNSECAVILERLGVVGLSKTGGSLYNWLCNWRLSCPT